MRLPTFQFRKNIPGLYFRTPIREGRPLLEDWTRLSTAPDVGASTHQDSHEHGLPTASIPGGEGAIAPNKNIPGQEYLFAPSKFCVWPVFIVSVLTCALFV